MTIYLHIKQLNRTRQGLLKTSELVVAISQERLCLTVNISRFDSLPSVLYCANKFVLRLIDINSTIDMCSNSNKKLWNEQCEAAHRLRGYFGIKTALDYLVGEKLFRFIERAERNPNLAGQLQHYSDAVRMIFNPYELAGYIATLKPKARKKLQMLVLQNS